MKIDFPEATPTNPTQCLALAISPSKIRTIVETLNERAPLIDHSEGWQFTNDNFYFTNEEAIHQLIERLIYIFTENNAAKDYFANLVLQELVVRLMQTNTNRLAFAIKYVQENIHRNLTIRELADKACMSEPNFFRCFKQQYGTTPVEYINRQRIQLAMTLLHHTEYSISDISFACGYNNLNYFLKVFKKATGDTPAGYRKKIVKF
jgi:AraC-like DNA-binding protein